MALRIEYTGRSKVIRALCERVNHMGSLGTRHDEAFYGDLGQEAYEHSQLTSGNPHRVTAEDLGLGNVVPQLEAIMFAIGMISVWQTHKSEQVVTHGGDTIIFHGVGTQNNIIYH